MTHSFLKYSLMFLFIFSILLIVPAFGQQRLSMLGSDTLLILNREWALEYEKKNPSVRIEVSGGGSGKGISALINGQIDIAAASRQMTDEEIKAFSDNTGGRRPWRIVVALDGIGVYLHNDNPVTELTIDQLAAILTGEINNWNKVGGGNRKITVYNRDKFSGTRGFVQSHVMDGKPFAEDAQEVSSTAMLTAAVSRNPGAIGYGGIAYAPGVHVIRLSRGKGSDGFWPSGENVMSAKYPLSRPLQYYVNPASVSPALESFLRWILGEEGQKVVSFVGYYPVAPTELVAEEDMGVVKVTPHNMEDYGLSISAEFTEINGQVGAVRLPGNRIKVRLSFAPSGSAMKRIKSVSLGVGDSVRAPLNPVRNQKTGALESVEFTLRPERIVETCVFLEAGPEEEPHAYEVGLREFHASP